MTVGSFTSVPLFPGAALTEQGLTYSAGREVGFEDILVSCQEMSPGERAFWWWQQVLVLGSRSDLDAFLPVLDALLGDLEGLQHTVSETELLLFLASVYAAVELLLATCRDLEVQRLMLALLQDLGEWVLLPSCGALESLSSCLERERPALQVLGG